MVSQKRVIPHIFKWDLEEKPPYDLTRVKNLLDEHTPAIKDFYGSWANFVTSLNRMEREIFNSPKPTYYDSKEACIAAIFLAGILSKTFPARDSTQTSLPPCSSLPPA